MMETKITEKYKIFMYHWNWKVRNVREYVEKCLKMIKNLKCMHIQNCHYCQMSTRKSKMSGYKSYLEEYSVIKYSKM